MYQARVLVISSHFPLEVFPGLLTSTGSTVGQTLLSVSLLALRNLSPVTMQGITHGAWALWTWGNSGAGETGASLLEEVTATLSAER